MTTSTPTTVPAVSPSAPLSGVIPEEERDAGVRAFRGLLVATAIAVPMWALIITGVTGVVRLFS